MPSPFMDSIGVQRIGGMMGVIPQLFINSWPGYQPSREAWLLELWLLISLAFLLVLRHRPSEP